jgi:hypothetical protein
MVVPLFRPYEKQTGKSAEQPTFQIGFANEFQPFPVAPYRVGPLLSASMKVAENQVERRERRVALDGLICDNEP